MKNVYIEQLDVGGLTYYEALDSINATYLLHDAAITLTSNGQTYEINGSDIGLTAVAEDTAKKKLSITANRTAHLKMHLPLLNLCSNRT